MLIIDAHLDLSMNALEWNRDLTLEVSQINDREKTSRLSDKPGRGNATVSLPALRNGNIGLVVATQIARFVSKSNPLPGWNSPAQAWAETQGQLAWYRAMEGAGQLIQVRDLEGLEDLLELRKSYRADTSSHPPLGYILSLEGADSIITLDYLQRAWENGLRAVGPAHYGEGRYANGTDSRGSLSSKGQALLREMEKLNIILDVTHLCEEAFWDSLNYFTSGNVWASHSNCRSLVDHNRQFSDDQLNALIERNAVIGVALDAWMLVPNWRKGISTPREMNCCIESMVDHMDHICQLAGNTQHVAIGSDLDGGFGREQSPYDLETITDLCKLEFLLAKRGYTADDITNILHGNWLRFLRRAWA